MPTRKKLIEQKTTAIRDLAFPDLNPDDLWHHRKSDGFTSIPRTLPIVMNIIDDLTKGKPASKTYFALWARVFPEMYVNLQSADDFAYYSGFTGQRAVRDWKQRMESLAVLGFIRLAAGPRGGMLHAVILNPHYTIRRLYKAKTPGLTEAAYNTLIDRAGQIGMADMTSPLPEEMSATVSTPAPVPGTPILTAG